MSTRLVVQENTGRGFWRGGLTLPISNAQVECRGRS